MKRIEELIAKCQTGDMEAKETIIMENSGLIWSVTRRFLGRGTDADDLYQLACLGFLKAVEGFDLGYGTQFSTYAVPKIAGEIRRYLRDDGAVKVSRSVKERAVTIKSVRSTLTNRLGREPTIGEIVEITGFSAEDIAMVESATANVESIHQVTGEESFSLENILADKQSEEKMIEQISLKQGIENLTERERMVIQLRYFHGLTQQKVSQFLLVSQVQVSRIEKQALEKLHDFLTK